MQARAHLRRHVNLAVLWTSRLQIITISCGETRPDRIFYGNIAKVIPVHQFIRHGQTVKHKYNTGRSFLPCTELLQRQHRPTQA
jgi:hypothetical protein